MDNYLIKLKKAFPFIRISFLESNIFKDITINGKKYHSMYYYDFKKIWHITNIIEPTNSFEKFLDNIILGLIYYGY